MAALYDPDEAAVLQQPWDEAFRTQRDVGLRVPINFLPTAAASLSAACFGKQQYEDVAFQKCFSNLLAAPFRRFLVDVYWDPGRSVWSLCPVEVPPSLAGPEVSTVSSASPTALMKRWIGIHPTTLPKERVFKAKPRQDASVPQSASSSVSSATVHSFSMTTTSTSATASPPPVQLFNQNNDSALLQIGSYNCTSTMTLSLLADIYNNFLDTTATTTEATITYLTLNVHAAASYLAPDAPAQKPGSNQLPVMGNLISDIMKGNLSHELYTPHKLQDERSNLNGSWFDVQWDLLPARGYYQTSLDSSNHLTTQDGWPTEAYMEFKELYRLVAAFGTIDPQMADYNMTTDLDTIFPPDTIHSIHNATFSSSGAVTSGCLFSASTLNTTSTTNSSFAVALSPPLNLGSSPDTRVPIPSITNLTSCGLSPFLNRTLSSATADQDVTPYIAFARSEFWTWAPGSPDNTSDTSPGSSINRCAAMHTDTTPPGRWRTLDCTSRHIAACQDPSNPYSWTLSSSPSRYWDVVCPSNTVFSVPHTALENTALLSLLSSLPYTSDPIFLNLNSLDVPDCWVSGANGTCPYISNTDTNKVRVVVVPTVAAVIIFVLAALTFFVKCAANRREDKRGRGRREVGGWEYEGVPS